VQQQIAEMIRRARRQSGLSQEALAFKVGLHPTNLSKLERAHFTPNSALLLALMRELKLGPTALLPILSGVSNKRATVEIELATLASRLTDEGLEIALEQVKALERLGKSGAKHRSASGSRGKK
jgi:transcriptional regulator with XRE-family HTH domain